MDRLVRERGAYGFGLFRLDAARRTLTRDGVAVVLTPTVFETLQYLVENPSRVVTKEELLGAVWPGRFVEEFNLTQAISTLRKALKDAGDDGRLIVTAPGRGYRFVADVIHIPASGDAIASSADFQPESRTGSTSVGAASPTPLPGWNLPWRFGQAPRMAAVGAATALTLIFVALLLLRRGPEPQGKTPYAPPPHSVAVLAFTNMSGDPARDFFSEGLSEELINTLSRINALQVAARVSSFSFKDGKAAIGDIGRKLNVRTVLEGSVRASGTRIRVTAQLIDASTGYQLWSHTYDRDRGDVLQLETDIAEAVAQSLEVTLLGSEKVNLTTGGTNNALAFDAYLRGASLIRTFDEASVRAALSAFEVAIRLDPAFADAHAGRAFALWGLGFVWPADPTPQQVEFGRALAEADRAIDLAPQSARAHATRAEILEWQLDLRGAEAEAVKAHEINGGDVFVERVYARIEAHHGHFAEAVAAARRLVVLDPLSAAQYYQLAGILLSCGKFEDALNALRREQAIGTANALMTHQMMADAHLGQGNARAALQDCANVCGKDSAEIAVADIKLGLVAEAKAVLARQKSEWGDKGALTYAAEYAQWGDTSTALHWLDVGFAKRSSALCAMRVEEFFAPIRNTPRFLEIERNLGFPPRTS